MCELRHPSPMSLPLMVERFREQLTTEQLSSRLDRILGDMERDAAGALTTSYSGVRPCPTALPRPRAYKLKGNGPLQAIDSHSGERNVMKPFHQKSLMLASSLAMLLALGACDRYGDQHSRQDACRYGGQATSRATEESRDAAAASPRRSGQSRRRDQGHGRRGRATRWTMPPSPPR